MAYCEIKMSLAEKSRHKDIFQILGGKKPRLRAKDVSSVAKHLLSMYKVIGSIPGTLLKKKELGSGGSHL